MEDTDLAVASTTTTSTTPSARSDATSSPREQTRGAISSDSRAKSGTAGEAATSVVPLGGESEGEAFAEVGHNGATESGADEAVASQAEVAAANLGPLSAASDLGAGYRRQESAGESSAVVLREAGEEAYGSNPNAANAEFLPLLAAVIPKLLTVAGPPLAKAVLSKLTPRAGKVIKTLGAAAPRVIGAAAPFVPGPTGSVLSMLSKLLSRESEKESAETIGEAEEQFAAEVAGAMEVIIGTDDRQRIQNTTDDPWRKICALRIRFPSGATYRGTGFFIGSRAVATAGHCVYLRNQGGWAREVEVIPAMNGDARPYGTARSSNLRSVSGWVNAGRPEADVGCIVLGANAFATHPGAFGFAAFNAAELKAQAMVLAGYPGDKPFAQMWGMARVVKEVLAKTLIYDIDTMGGQSGAPVYVKRNGQRYVVGIHNYGAQQGNSASRITPSMYDLLLRWSSL